ncbi:MAG: MFS transporter, partial [Synergistaceae bacterium]|nr:MFS transporter [Synergistaceae bacterium]
MDSLRSWFFFALLALGFLYSGLIRISGVVILPIVADSLGISASMVGFLSSLFFYTYGLSFGILGPFVDRFGSFRTCGITLLCAAAGSFVLMYADTPMLIGLGRIISGFGLASTFTGIIVFCAAAFPAEKYSMFAGLCLTIGHFGTILAVAPLGSAIDVFGLKTVYLFLALFPAILGLVLLVFRSYDPSYSKSAENIRTALFGNFVSDIVKGIKTVWSLKSLRIVGLVWAFSSACIITLQGLWAVTWIQASAGVSADIARNCATWISIGMVAGPAAGSVITLRNVSGKKILMSFSVMILLSWLFWCLASFFNAPVFMLAISGLLLGFIVGMGFVYMCSMTRKLAPDDKGGTAVGIISMSM